MEAWAGFLVIGGVAIFAASHRWQLAGRTLGRWAALGVSIFLVQALAITPTAFATSHTVITSDDVLYQPFSNNGWKIYLSSPRHSDSRYRGECGWEENINGRRWNVWAAWNASNSLFDRTYRTIVSANARDDGYLENRENSNNWNANFHIVTHTNADVGCGDSTQYLLVMWNTGYTHSWQFRNDMIDALNPVVPGGNGTLDCDGLAECHADATHRIYVELLFHTNQSAVNWLQSSDTSKGVRTAFRYGTAIDIHLGYPR